VAISALNAPGLALNRRLRESPSRKGSAYRILAQCFHPLVGYRTTVNGTALSWRFLSPHSA